MLHKLLLLTILVMASLHSHAQDDNAERIKATYMYADSIPDSLNYVPNKSISKFKGIKTEKEKEALSKKDDQRPFLQRVIRPEKHSPLTATALSLVLPGAGQVYNKSYWKLPIVYAGLGWTGYNIYQTTDDYRNIRDTYFNISGIDTTAPVDSSLLRYSEGQLNTLRREAKNRQELAIIRFGIVYVLVAAEAFVDAHLWHFDVDDDLSLGLRPALLADTRQRPVPGISLSLYGKRSSPAPPFSF